MAEELVPAVEPPGVHASEPFHARHQIGSGRFQHQMKMIVHQAPGVDSPIGPLTRLGERLQEDLPVGVVPEDSLAMIAATQDMIQSPGKFDAQFTGHE
jgi:hypothetical protein